MVRDPCIKNMLRDAEYYSCHNPRRKPPHPPGLTRRWPCAKVASVKYILTAKEDSEDSARQ